MSFYKGNNEIKKILVSFDSLFRADYKNTPSCNCEFILPVPINNVVSMKVTSIEIPYAWHEFSETERSNEFTIIVYNYAAIDETTQTVSIIPETRYTIKIPPGNYQSGDLQTALNNYFINVGGGLSYLYSGININTTKTVIRAVSITDTEYTTAPYNPDSPYYSPDFYFELDFRLQDNLTRPIYMNMGWILGYREPTYSVTVNHTYMEYIINNPLGTGPIMYHAYLQCETSYGFSATNYIFLDIDDNNKFFTSDAIMSFSGSSYITGNNILARMVMATPQNSVNFITNSDYIFSKRDYYGAVKIDYLKIRVLDKYGNILSLGGNDFSFMLEFSVINA